MIKGISQYLKKIVFHNLELNCKVLFCITKTTHVTYRQPLTNIHYAYFLITTFTQNTINFWKNFTFK